MKIKEAIEILSKYGKYGGKIIGEDEYVFDFGEGEETFCGYQIKKIS